MSAIFIDDVWLHVPSDESKGGICLSATANNGGADISFTAEKTLFNEETQENDSLGVEEFPASEFSRWFNDRMREGWRIST